MLKHHVFLVRNWEKIRQKQEEVKHVNDNLHSASLYTRWNGMCRDDGNIKSGEAPGVPPPLWWLQRPSLSWSSRATFPSPHRVPVSDSPPNERSGNLEPPPGPSHRPRCRSPAENL